MTAIRTNICMYYISVCEDRADHPFRHARRPCPQGTRYRAARARTGGALPAQGPGAAEWQQDHRLHELSSTGPRRHNRPNGGDAVAPRTTGQRQGISLDEAELDPVDDGGIGAINDILGFHIRL